MGPSSSRPSFTYASDEVGPLSRVVIRAIEAVTGQPKIRRLYEHYTRRGRPPELFWDDAVEALELNIRSNPRAGRLHPAQRPGRSHRQSSLRRGRRRDPVLDGCARAR
ncbi:MAG: hypothetical protein WDN69_03130 [Aliidongia sp.]